MNILKIILNKIRLFSGFFETVEEEINIPERIPFKFISEKLIYSAKVSRDEIGKTIIIPSTYIIKFSPEDRALRKNVENILASELKKELRKEISSWKGVDVNTKFDLRIETDSAMNKGEFYIDCTFAGAGQLIEENFSEHAYSRADISNTFISPSDNSELENNPFVGTLLNPEEDRLVKRYNYKRLFSINVTDSHGERMFYLENGSYVIGRGSSSDIVLAGDDTRVSRNHISLNLKEQEMKIKMTGRNGGKVNIVNLEKDDETSILSGDKIFIGNSTIMIKK